MVFVHIIYSHCSESGLDSILKLITPTQQMRAIKKYWGGKDMFQNEAGNREV